MSAAMCLFCDHIDDTVGCQRSGQSGPVIFSQSPIPFSGIISTESTTNPLFSNASQSLALKAYVPGTYAMLFIDPSSNKVVHSERLHSCHHQTVSFYYLLHLSDSYKYSTDQIYVCPSWLLTSVHICGSLAFYRNALINRHSSLVMSVIRLKSTYKKTTRYRTDCQITWRSKPSMTNTHCSAW